MEKLWVFLHTSEALSRSCGVEKGPIRPQSIYRETVQITLDARAVKHYVTPVQGEMREVCASGFQHYSQEWCNYNCEGRRGRSASEFQYRSQGRCNCSCCSGNERCEVKWLEVGRLDFIMNIFWTRRADLQRSLVTVSRRCARYHS